MRQHGLAIEGPSMSDGLDNVECDRWTDQKGRRINKSTYSENHGFGNKHSCIPKDQ